MSKLPPFCWSRALALLVPAVVKAQAGTDSPMKASEPQQVPTIEGVTSFLGAIGADTGQVSVPADTVSRAKPARQSGKSKKPHHDGAADSVKTRDDRERGEYYSPY